MKYLTMIGIAATMLLEVTGAHAYALDTSVSIEQVAAKVKSQNVTVLEEMQKVYQAKQSINFARGNLLPKLNLWRIINAAASFPVGLLGLLEDLVPFLVPNNWLALKQQSLFYKAELEGAKAVKANQVFNAKSLYYMTLSDISLRELVNDCLTSTQDVLAYVKIQEQFGYDLQGVGELLKIRLLALQDDLTSLDQLIYTERQSLSMLLGISTSDLIQLVAVNDELPTQNLDSQLLEKEALKISPELKQYDFLIDASKLLKKEAWFSILGTSSMSRGVAGGIFDGFPVQDGLGFGMSPSIKIGKSYTKMIGLQKEGAQQTLARQVQAMSTTFNLDYERNLNAKRRLGFAVDLFDQFRERLKMGVRVDPLDLVEALQQKLQAKTDALVIETRMRQTLEKVQRITFATNDYKDEAKEAGLK